MTRVLPYPLLTAGLVVMWLLLTRVSLGQVLLGTAIAIGAGLAMRALKADKPRIRRWHRVPVLAAHVVADILRSNIAVAAIILQGGRRERVSGFVEIHLRLRDRTGLAVLACIITSTPGTAWVRFDPETGELLLHVLDLVDEADWAQLIGDRYERLLMEIFE